jgi:hypothetical protein
MSSGFPQTPGSWQQENSRVGDWQLTATAIYCDAVDDDVTIIVYKDWSTKCTGYNMLRSLTKKQPSCSSRKSDAWGGV